MLLSAEKKKKEALINGLCRNVRLVTTLGEVLKSQPGIISKQNELPNFFTREKTVKKMKPKQISNATVVKKEFHQETSEQKNTRY